MAGHMHTLSKQITPAARRSAHQRAIVVDHDLTRELALPPKLPVTSDYGISFGMRPAQRVVKAWCDAPPLRRT
jgi:hypothetical protein